MAKLPAIQFYPGDWKKDAGVQALDYHHRGVWFEMMLLMFEAEPRGKLTLNGKKMPIEALANSLGLDNQEVNQIVNKLVDYGVAKVEQNTGIIYNARMVRDEEIRKLRKTAGKLGGNPVLVKQNPTTQVKQKSTPSVSSSFSSSVIKEGGGKATPPKKDSPELVKIESAWKTEYRRLYDSEPDWNFGRDRKIIKVLLQRHGFELVERVVMAHVKSGRLLSIPGLQTCFNDLLAGLNGKGPPAKQTKREQQYDIIKKFAADYEGVEHEFKRIR